MNKNLAGKTVFITAAGQGIGRATARAFVNAGATVHASDINTDTLASLASEVDLVTHALDVRDAVSVKQVIQNVGPVDVLFNCAGFVHHGTVLDVTEDELDFAFDLNLKSMVRTIQAVLPGMLERGDGSIINMSSLVGSVKGVVNRCTYGITKAAVVGLTKSVSADYVQRGIRCNAICPGTVQSPSLDQRLHATGDYDKALAEFIARQPMGRLGTPEEIAELVVYLAGARYTSGSVYMIDGGWLN